MPRCFSANSSSINSHEVFYRPPSAQPPRRPAHRRHGAHQCLLFRAGGRGPPARLRPARTARHLRPARPTQLLRPAAGTPRHVGPMRRQATRLPALDRHLPADIVGNKQRCSTPRSRAASCGGMRKGTAAIRPPAPGRSAKRWRPASGRRAARPGGRTLRCGRHDRQVGIKLDLGSRRPRRLHPARRRRRWCRIPIVAVGVAIFMSPVLATLLATNAAVPSATVTKAALAVPPS